MAFHAWDPTNKDADIALSNENYTATNNNGTSAHVDNVRSDTPLDPAGKIYFEVHGDTVADADFQTGIVTEDWPVSAGLMTWNYESWGYDRYWDKSAHRPNENYYSEDDETISNGDIIMVAVDMDEGDIWFGLNGTWKGSGNPATGANPAFTGQDFTTKDMYIGLNLQTGSSGGATVATLVTDMADFSYSIPSGFTTAGEAEASVDITAEPFELSAELTGTPLLRFSLPVAMSCGGARATTIPRTRQFYRVWITGAGDGLSNLEVVASSVQCRARSGDPTFISVVIPVFSYATAIAARSNGQVVVEIVYKTAAGVVLQAEEIARADISDIQTHEGGKSRSIVVEALGSTTYSPKTVALSGVVYRRLAYGRTSLRFAKPDPYLRPGDTVTTDLGDSVEADAITYTLSPRNMTMEVSEA
jgi:hypothetical protein